MDSGVASEASFKEKIFSIITTEQQAANFKKALRQLTWLTPAFTIKSDSVLPSGESLRVGTGSCGSCEDASELNANPGAKDGVYGWPFICWAWKKPYLHLWKTHRLE